MVFEPGPPSIRVSKPVVSREGMHPVATAGLVSAGGGPVLFNRGAMVVTVPGRQRAVKIAGCPSP
ncbi:MAG: hypothetical protein IOC80_06510 [Rhodobacter sp.]|nr:hypothetical protein [Rhodobacter sp.]MCA3515077.1 hypothetical protein [Rhodobacter sp.]MCA3521561.1 hypothetical protein [Rhodobacter sp.]MCA3521889.1 hypothetical protein [Rhodobacter sp.]MCA3524812.1 hypothetical protein [Rhodobacter sp.]